MAEIMAPKIVTVEEAEAHLRELIDLAEQGEEVVIAYEDQPKVKLVPIRPALQKRVFGQQHILREYAQSKLTPAAITEAIRLAKEAIVSAASVVSSSL